MHNLLTSPLIRYRQSGGTLVETSLPEVYEALMADKVDAFPALRPHQRHAWHAFLVQLGAMAMHRDGLDAPPSDADEWRRIIRALTPDWPGDEPWQLVVDDITKPAFMQPPASSDEKSEEYGTKPAKRGKQLVRVPDEDKICRHPDKLDMLVTAKNHDVKAEVIEQFHMDDWIFALVTLQTMEGYGGAGNYGISRMPSGYGNRPAFSLTPSVRPGGHARHDLIALLRHRQSLLKEYPLTDSGVSLMWTIPWDGTEAESRPLTDMDPYYIEICRRVRLKGQSGKIVADRANSEPRGRRIVDAKGLTGDPWAPVSNNVNPKGTPPAFLGPRKFFGYERVVDGLFSADWKQPLLLSPAASGRESTDDMNLVARGMVRGEGGTEGFHERIIPLRHRTLQVFGRPGGAEQLGDIARQRIEQISNVEDTLRYAIAVFVAKGEDLSKLRPQDRNTILYRGEINSLIEGFTRVVDDQFFDHLQAEFEAEDKGERDRIRTEWLINFVIHKAGQILSDSRESLPCPDSQRIRATATSDNTFKGVINQKFSDYLL